MPLCDLRCWSYRRSVVMKDAVEATNDTYNWFFVVYRFVVGVLFSQLMVGVLIAIFGEASSMDATAAGEVLYALKDKLADLSGSEQMALVKELGLPAKYVLDCVSMDLVPNTKLQRTDSALPEDYQPTPPSSPTNSIMSDSGCQTAEPSSIGCFPNETDQASPLYIDPLEDGQAHNEQDPHQTLHAG